MIHKEALNWAPVANALARSTKNIARAGKWSWNVTRGASKFAGKKLSVSGRFALKNTERYTQYVTSMSKKFNFSELAKDSEKTKKVIEIAKTHNLIDEEEVLRKMASSPSVIKTVQKTFPEYAEFLTEVTPDQVRAAINKAPQLARYFDLQLLQQITPKLGETVSHTPIFLREVTVGLNKLRTGASPAQLKSIDHVAKQMDEVIASGKGIGETSERIMAQFTKLSQSMSKPIPNELAQAAEAAKGSNIKVNEFLNAMKNSKLLTIEESAFAKNLSQAVNSFEYVHAANALSVKNIVAIKGTLLTILLGSTLIGGGLVGEHVALIKELKSINGKIVKELKEMPPTQDAAGQAWKKEQERLIEQLTQLDSIDVSAYESANGNNMDEDSMSKMMLGLEDLGPRFEAVGAALDEISTSKALEASYQNGSKASGVVGETVDYLNPASHFGYGNISKFNKIKSLATNGLEALGKSGEKIAKSSEQLNEALMKAELGEPKQEEAQVTADYIMDQFIAVGGLMNQANSYREIDRIEQCIIKKTAAGYVGLAWLILEALGDSGNLITKAYIHLSDMWDQLEPNVNEVVEHLVNFNDFKPDSNEGVNFQKNTQHIINSMKENLKVFKENFPIDDKSALKSGDDKKLKELAKNIASGKEREKLLRASRAIDNLYKAYETVMSQHWYDQYSKFAKSWWQSMATGYGMAFTMFSGKSILDRYERMVYEAKGGIKMIGSLKAAINDVLNEGQEMKASIELPQ